MHSENFDVIAIGNAIVDLLINTDESFLVKNSLKKGTMTLISQEKAEELLLSNKNSLKISGGSAANTIAGLSQLGSSTGFIGRVKDDQLGNIFRSDICSTGTVFNTPSIRDGESTARCFIYITPDAERTMCTYLGSSIFLESKDIDFSMLTKAKVLYLEGYLWDLDKAKNAFITAAKRCKSEGVKIALSLSDSFCVERHRDSFKELLEDYVDIVFANENEIIELYQSKNFSQAMNTIKSKCEIAVLTKGKEGSVIISKDNIYKISSYSFSKVIDTTGAGDLYASGFLYGYVNGKDLLTCGNIGSICAGHIVTQFGSRSTQSLKDLVRDNLPESN